MRKPKREKQSNKNIRIGIYFGIVVVFIILVSFTFKIFDSFKKSTFDTGNFYTVAVNSDNEINLISISPKENTLKKLTISGLSSEEKLKDLGIPYDSNANSKKDNLVNPKSVFTKMLFHQDGMSGNLTTIDLIKLSIFSNKVSGDNVEVENVSIDDVELSKIVSSWFLDPEIVKEQVKVEVVNTTEISGLGNKVANIITNAGGNVVLVNSSQEDLGDSIIYYSSDSYTVEKISRLLGIKKEKKELNSVSDIVIRIGKDRVGW